MRFSLRPIWDDLNFAPKTRVRGAPSQNGRKGRRASRRYYKRAQRTEAKREIAQELASMQESP